MSLSNRGTVPLGGRDPLALEIDITPSDTVSDLSVVTAASLKVWRVNNVIEVWTCAMSNQTATTLKLTHPWVEGDNDTANEGLRIWPQLTIGGRVYESSPVIVTVTQR